MYQPKKMLPKSLKNVKKPMPYYLIQTKESNMTNLVMPLSKELEAEPEALEALTSVICQIYLKIYLEEWVALEVSLDLPTQVAEEEQVVQEKAMMSYTE